MIWDINNFATLSKYHEGDTITFGDDSKGKIIGVGNIKIGSSPLIENIILIEGLERNLWSITNFVIKVLKLFSMISLATF